MGFHRFRYLEVMMRSPLVVGAFLALCSCAVAETNEISVQTLLHEMTDLNRLARRSNPTYTTAQSSSYDRASKAPDQPNWFANGDAGQFIRVESKNGQNEYVMADLKGPGTVVRFWSANPAGVVRFYFDGENVPRLMCPLNTLLGGQFPNIADPFAYVASSGWNMYFPIPYAKSLKITVDQAGSGIYYHVNYRTYSSNASVKSFTTDQLPALKDLILQTGKILLDPDKRTLPIGTVTQKIEKKSIASGSSFVKSISGKNKAVYELSIRVLNPQPSKNEKWTSPKQLHNILRLAEIKIECDNELCVLTPLGDLFGSAPGLNPFKTYPLEMRKDGWMICRFVQPFKKNWTLRIANHGKEPLQLESTIKVGSFKWDGNAYYFRAQWTAERSKTRPISDMHYLNVKGEGTFIGTNMHIATPSRQWWGEGDEKFYVDGETFPSTFGTGTEDYYGYAWGNPTPFERPYHAQPRAGQEGPYGHVSNARYHLFDDVPYTKSFKMDLELWHWDTLTVTVARTAYWYSKPGGTTSALINRALLAVPELPGIPKVEGAFEGESLTYAKTGGQCEVQGTFWDASGAKHLWWRDAKVGDKLTFQIPVKKAGTYELVAQFGYAPDYGIHRLSLNGAPLGDPLDFLSEGLTWKATSFGKVELKEGVNLLVVECMGKNEKAKPGNMFALDYVLLK
jgi:hypothetical protein